MKGLRYNISNLTCALKENMGKSLCSFEVPDEENDE